MTDDLLADTGQSPRSGVEACSTQADRRRPVRIVILGNSCAIQVCTRNLAPDDAPYAEVLRELLVRDGQLADVRNHSAWMGTVRDAVRVWPQAVWSAWPDLVIIHHGINEARSRVIPPALHRRTWTLDRTDGRAESYLVPRLQARWSKFAAVAARFDRPGVPGHMGARRFGQQMARLVGQTVVHTQAVCVIVGLNPVNDILLRFGRAYETRRDRLMHELSEVARARPRVAIARLEDIQYEIGDSKGTFPDGMHLSPLAHRLLAGRIAGLYKEMTSPRRQMPS